MRPVSLLEVFAQLEDPRKPRGVRHPFAGVVVLTLLGMLGRMREMEVIVRWAAANWGQLREPLGFDRDQPPCATTLSRTLAQCTVAQFQAAFTQWLRVCLAERPTDGVFAVDGKTAKQGRDADGQPLHLLQVFLHDLQAVVAQWPVGPEKTNEPGLLRRRLGELLEAYPCLRLLTADAIFAQRPLAELICGHRRHYLLAIKENQPETLDALQQCFAQAVERPAAAETVEKRGI